MLENEQIRTVCVTLQSNHTSFPSAYFPRLTNRPTENTNFNQIKYPTGTTAKTIIYLFFDNLFKPNNFASLICIYSLSFPKIIYVA
jgi:hypothetical protein